jgi:hypothetical protein
VSEPTNGNTSSKSFARYLYEVLLSLNVGYAVALSVWTFVHRGDPHTLSIYFMLPGERLLSGIAANIDRSRHLNVTGGTGHEIALMIFIFVIAILVLIFLRLIALTGLSPKILDFAGGIVALAFVPALWLHANQAAFFPNPAFSFWASFHWSLFDIEGPLACAAMYYGRKGRLPLWVCVLILIFHYTWWLGWMWSDLYWAPNWWESPMWVTAVFFVVFPASGFAWLFYIRRMRLSGI